MSDDRLLLTSGSVEETARLGAALAAFLAPDDVIVLSGDLGAGKTHLTKGIARGLQVADEITSPTFNIVLEYPGFTADGAPIMLYHFDLYRLDEPDQLEDIDYFGLLESDGVSVVEWGDRFSAACPDDCLLVKLTLGAGDTRVIEASACAEGRGHELLESWREALGAAPSGSQGRG